MGKRLREAIMRILGAIIVLLIFMKGLKWYYGAEASTVISEGIFVVIAAVIGVAGLVAIYSAVVGGDMDSRKVSIKDKDTLEALRDAQTTDEVKKVLLGIDD